MASGLISFLLGIIPFLGNNNHIKTKITPLFYAALGAFFGAFIWPFILFVYRIVIVITGFYLCTSLLILYLIFLILTYSRKRSNTKYEMPYCKIYFFTFYLVYTIVSIFILWWDYNDSVDTSIEIYEKSGIVLYPVFVSITTYCFSVRFK